MAKQRISGQTDTGYTDYHQHPERLIGEHIVRRFKKNDDDEDSDSELYSGEIISYKKPYWRVYYDADGDEQELQISEVLECLVYQN